ncbi:MAG: type II toxin-antitoxin system RelB/DinJ family antitoxin [Oscillospiraceae bacterium]|nr:type II toxin-antitoxin system RelB/DinJ family antitoxin [Oscillospiraceae bacterium]
MASTLVQFRTDEITRIKATNICEQLGIDLPTYMRICITRLVQENGIPFSMRIEEEEDSGVAAYKAMREASRIAEENGIADMTLDEINAEISEARKNRK